jgi:hypothetical protein
MDINVFSVDDLTDDDLKRLMDKYHEKQTRYELKMNEATERNQKIINLIYQEQARRLICSDVSRIENGYNIILIINYLVMLLDLVFCLIVLHLLHL